MNLGRAIETGDVSQLPGRRDEDWRWTDLRGLVRAVPPASPEAIGEGFGVFAAFAADRIIVVNGRGARDIVVPAGERQTVVLRFVSKADGTSHSASLSVDVGEGASLTLLESYEAQGAGYLAYANLDIRLGKGASLDRVLIAADADDAISVSQADVVLAGGAAYAETKFTTGARRQRLETTVTHPGGSASVRLDGAYLIGEKRFADLTSSVTHSGKDGRTSELVKGAVSGQGRAVFQGRIVVAQGADQTDARMGHHALILSDRGEVDAKPELLIYADDVSCAHGNTVGALDENALFYARQRGIPEAEAKAMLTEAFIGEVIDRITHEGAREICRAWVAEKLAVLA